jgi:protein-tyrosine phosphatase
MAMMTSEKKLRILMVCLGNICRSPMAEGILQRLAKEEDLPWQVDSAGTNRYHTGEAPHPSSQKVCLEHGIDISAQRARTFLAEDMERYDLLFALATDVRSEMKKIAGASYQENKVKLIMDMIAPGQEKSVTDPWYGTEDGYYPVFQEIHACCEAIIKKYKEQ